MKKTRITLLTMLTMILCLALTTGCSGTGSNQASGDDSATSAINSSPSISVVQALVGPAEKIYSYSTTNVSDYMGEYITNHYVGITDATTAIYVCQTYYDDTATTYNVIKGTYTKTDDRLTVTSLATNFDEYSYEYGFVLSNDEIVGVVDPYDETDGIRGTYTGHSDEYGDLTLTIVSSTDVTLTIGDGTELHGTIYAVNERMDLMVADEEYNTSIDWYVDFDGDTFTYEEYSEAIYKDYTGTMTADGDLGVLEFTLNKDGTVEVSVPLNGVSERFTGNYYVDTDNQTVTSAYLTSEDELYTLNLEFVDIEGSGMNYSGTLSSPLAAG